MKNHFFPIVFIYVKFLNQSKILKATDAFRSESSPFQLPKHPLPHWCPSGAPSSFEVISSIGRQHFADDVEMIIRAGDKLCQYKCN